MIKKIKLFRLKFRVIGEDKVQIRHIKADNRTSAINKLIQLNKDEIIIL